MTETQSNRCAGTTLTAVVSMIVAIFSLMFTVSSNEAARIDDRRATCVNALEDYRSAAYALARVTSASSSGDAITDWVRFDDAAYGLQSACVSHKVIASDDENYQRWASSNQAFYDAVGKSTIKDSPKIASTSSDLCTAAWWAQTFHNVLGGMSSTNPLFPWESRAPVSMGGIEPRSCDFSEVTAP